MVKKTRQHKRNNQIAGTKYILFSLFRFITAVIHLET